MATNYKPIILTTATFTAGGNTYTDAQGSAAAGDLTNIPVGTLILVTFVTTVAITNANTIRWFSAGGASPDLTKNGSTAVFWGIVSATYRSVFADIGAGTFGTTFTYWALQNPSML